MSMFLGWLSKDDDKKGIVVNVKGEPCEGWIKEDINMTVGMPQFIPMTEILVKEVVKELITYTTKEVIKWIKERYEECREKYPEIYDEVKCILRLKE